MDVDLGGSARIPLHAFDVDGLDVSPAEVAVYVKQPDATVLGPLAISQADLDRREFLFTTTQAGPHRYRVVETATDVQVAEGTFYVWPTYTDSSTAWVPGLDEVAALVPTRTFDDTNTQQNTFTPTTTPTSTQVNGYITQVVGEIVGSVGQIASSQFAQAKHTATLGVAWLVERSFPPTSDVQNVANDFVNDYRASLRLLQQSQSGAEGGARALSVSLDAYTWPEV